MRSLSAWALVAATAILVATTGPATGEEAPAPRTFAFAIGEGNLADGADAVAERLGRFELVVVDGEEARRAEVAALRARGTIVHGYLSVGTIESWRGWYPRVRQYRLSAWRDWEDEWFGDVSRRGFRREIAARIAPGLIDKGFDGLFLDNVDMIEARRHREQRAGMAKLVAALDRLVHEAGGLLFAQNGHRILVRLGILGSLDGWNREDVSWGYDFDRRRYVRRPAAEIRAAQEELRDVAGRGLIVTATDYTRPDDAAAREEAVANACAAGALPFVSGIGLTARRLPDPPLACP